MAENLMKVALIVAMQKEMDSLTALLKDKKEETVNGFRYVTGELDGKQLVLHQCGIGKVNAAVGASELIRTYHPDCIVSTGCAGGLSSELKVMDVVASRSTVYHDIYIGDTGEGLDIERPFHSNLLLVKKAEELSKHSLVNIHLGQICTGDQFLTERPKLEDISKRFPEGLAVDMESCAIAHACNIYDVPFISFRIISDTIGAEFHLEEYRNFWSEMANHSFEVVKAYIASL